MSIGERIEDLIPRLFDSDTNLLDVREILRMSFLEVARDQRLACCDAIHAMAPEDVCRDRCEQVAREAEVK